MCVFLFSMLWDCFLGLWERGLKMIGIFFHGLVVY